MPKRYIILVFLIILAIISLSIYGYSLFNANSKKDLESCKNIGDEYARDWCYNKIAIEENNRSICLNIENSERISFCNDYGVSCERMPMQRYKDECYGNTAIIKIDSSLCEKVISEGKKDWCGEHVAEIEKNPSICTKVNDVERPDWCYTILPK